MEVLGEFILNEKLYNQNKFLQFLVYHDFLIINQWLNYVKYR